jgi:oxalate decarboxylase
MTKSRSEMDDLNRRQLLIATTAVGGIVAASGVASARGGTGDGGRPVLPKTPDTYRFPLASTTPQIVRSGGSITKAVPDDFPVLEDNQVSAGYLVLKPGALREPHWHPTHWEVDYAVQGAGELGIVTPDDQQSISRLKPGDIGFIPTGWAHYIRNVGTSDLIWVLVFNNPLTDIGLSTMFGGMPTSTFTQTLGVPLAGATKPPETRFIV